MRIKDVILAPKTDIEFGSWETDRMPPSAFPLGKSKKGLKLGADYDWCTIRFDAVGAQFRVLVAVNFRKVDYYAHLGRIEGTDTKMLVSYEYHATHGGWHVHAGCGDIELIPVGRYKGPWKRNIPQDWHTCRQLSWNVTTKDKALERACLEFGIQLTGTQPDFLP